MNGLKGLDIRDLDVKGLEPLGIEDLDAKGFKPTAFLLRLNTRVPRFCQDILSRMPWTKPCAKGYFERILSRTSKERQG